MSLGRYLKDRAVPVLLVLAADLMACSILWAAGVGWELTAFAGGALLAAGCGGCLWDWLRRRVFYRRAGKSLDGLDKKYLLSELLEEPGFYEGDEMCETLAAACKAMNDEVAAARREGREYREYIEGWVHEIKTPIAAVRLRCENSRSPLTREIDR